MGVFPPLHQIQTRDRVEGLEKRVDCQLLRRGLRGRDLVLQMVDLSGRHREPVGGVVGDLQVLREQVLLARHFYVTLVAGVMVTGPWVEFVIGVDRMHQSTMLLPVDPEHMIMYG